MDFLAWEERRDQASPEAIAREGDSGSPKPCTNRRTAISGFVSFDFTAAMMRERSQFLMLCHPQVSLKEEVSAIVIDFRVVSVDLDDAQRITRVRMDKYPPQANGSFDQNVRDIVVVGITHNDSYPVGSLDCDGVQSGIVVFLLAFGIICRNVNRCPSASVSWCWAQIYKVIKRWTASAGTPIVSHPEKLQPR